MKAMQSAFEIDAKTFISYFAAHTILFSFIISGSLRRASCNAMTPFHAILWLKPSAVHLSNVRAYDYRLCVYVQDQQRRQ